MQVVQRVQHLAGYSNSFPDTEFKTLCKELLNASAFIVWHDECNASNSLIFWIPLRLANLHEVPMFELIKQARFRVGDSVV